MNKQVNKFQEFLNSIYLSKIFTILHLVNIQQVKVEKL